MVRGFTRAEASAYDAAERSALLAQAARLAATGEFVRARAAEHLAVVWRRYVATRWCRVDQYTLPPETIETLDDALHRLTRIWRGASLEADTIARFLRDHYDTDRMK